MAGLGTNLFCSRSIRMPTRLLWFAADFRRTIAILRLGGFLSESFRLDWKREIHWDCGRRSVSHVQVRKATGRMQSRFAGRTWTYCSDSQKEVSDRCIMARLLLVMRGLRMLLPLHASLNRIVVLLDGSVPASANTLNCDDLWPSRCLEFIRDFLVYLI